MIGYTDILLHPDHILTRDEEKVFITAIREYAQTSWRAIDATLDMLRYESGTLELQLEEVDLSELIKQVTSEISAHINYSYDRIRKDRHEMVKPDFVYAILDELPIISADRFRIHRILVEILLRAVREYERKSESRIVLTVDYDDNWVTITVIDDGVGLQSHLDEQESIMYPTNQHIIEMHGGKIEVEKPDGRGWIVKLILPIHQNEHRFSNESSS